MVVPLEEYLSFDVVIHLIWEIDGRYFGWVTFNRPAPAAND